MTQGSPDEEERRRKLWKMLDLKPFVPKDDTDVADAPQAVPAEEYPPATDAPAEPQEAEHDSPGTLETLKAIFQENMECRRKVAGLTQFQLAERVGLTQSHISKLQRGAIEPTFEVLIRVADALGVEVYQLFKRIVWSDDKKSILD